MVLSKRKRDGEFTVWTPGSQDLSVAGPSDPKRTKTDSLTQLPQFTATSALQMPSLEGANAPRAKQTAMVSQGVRSFQSMQTPQAIATLPRRVEPSQPIASSSSASIPAKRRTKKVAGNGEPVEKRGAKFKAKCPQNILDRVERVGTQRIFMIDRRRNGQELREEFSVLGSTGNVYTVVIDRIPKCNCPDASKGNHCKHILFVFLKVLQVSRQSGFWYQKALLTSELQQIFAEAPLAPNSVAHPHIRDAYARATGRIPANAPSTAAPAKNKRVPGPDDDCPICYDGMHGVAKTSLTYCEECGNAVHKECFQQWQGTSARTGKELTCVWCRAKWVVAPGVQAGVGGVGVSRTVHGHGYLNLSAVTGSSPIRDTSTYYHGPRRGQRYFGWQEYDDL